MTAAIPSAKDSDIEDVSWALSTAEAMWGRGDRADAVKWLRRAAEAASEAEEDDRALELAKAAADLTQLLERGGSTPASPARASSAGQAEGKAAPTGVSARPPAPAKAAAAKPAAQASPSQPHGQAQARPAAAQPRPAAGQRPSQSDAARKARKSAHGLEDPAPRAHADARKSQPGQKRAAGLLDDRKRRSTIPPPADTTPAREDHTETRTLSLEAREERPRPPSSPPPSGRGTEPRTPEELESWPTQALAGEALSGLAEEMTRVSSPGFTEETLAHAGQTQAMPAVGKSSVRPATRPSEAPGGRPSQAMRVVVWRSGDGVHVAPAGTRVTAPTIEALLVALDASADLAAWLVGK